MKLGVLINAFARTSELKHCLRAVLEATKNLNSERLILHQTGIPESMEISKSYSKNFVLEYVNPVSRNALECINANRIQGLTILFDDFKVDGVLAVEDDVEISADAAFFCEYVYEIFFNRKDFRGINLGSRIPRLGENDLTDTYSLLRYGLHGQAGLITRETWESICNRKLGRRNDSGFDSQIEFFLKTGFMVTSNYSRYLDRGFDQHATHAIKNRNDESFVRLRASYLGKDYFPKVPEYHHLQMSHISWRRDAIPYSKFDNAKYKLKNAAYSRLSQRRLIAT